MDFKRTEERTRANGHGKRLDLAFERRKVISSSTSRLTIRTKLRHNPTQVYSPRRDRCSCSAVLLTKRRSNFEGKNLNKNGSKNMQTNRAAGKRNPVPDPFEKERYLQRTKVCSAIRMLVDACKRSRLDRPGKLKTEIEKWSDSI